MYTLRVLHPSGDEQNYYLGDLYKVTLKDKSPDNFKLTYDSYLEENIDLKVAFESLTPGRQRAYLLHFGGAKQSLTRAARVDKCIPNILKGIGLNDAYQ